MQRSSGIVLVTILLMMGPGCRNNAQKAGSGVAAPGSPPQQVDSEASLLRDVGKELTLTGLLVDSGSKDESVWFEADAYAGQSMMVNDFDRQRFQQLVGQKVTVIGRLGKTVPITDPMVQHREGSWFYLAGARLPSGVSLTQRPIEEVDPFAPGEELPPAKR